MQTVRVHGASREGTGALVVTVEARFSGSDSGPVEVHLTGLPDNVLRESRGRLSCVLAASRMSPGPGKLYLNLVPAARRKSGEALDLALVVASAAASGHLTGQHVARVLFLGEVGIDGQLHATPGGLAAAVAARRLGIRTIIAPPETAQEAAALGDVTALAADHVRDVFRHLTHRADEGGALPRAEPTPVDAAAARNPETLDDVRGQEEAKYALQVAAAGGHGLLLVGPPGAGKSMLARRLIDLLPAMELAERIDVTTVLSASGRWPRGLASRRPFRAPHHTTSFAGLIGGGTPIQPGEITLASGGVLFLDELPEFGRDTLEGLRQPIEDGEVLLARAGRRATMPARFQLVCAMNPCPCGYAGHPKIPCHCPPSNVRRYRQRISGPLLDRIDLRVSMQPASVDVLLGRPPGQIAPRPAGPLAGAEIGARVMGARERAKARNVPSGEPNAALDADQLDTLAPLDTDARAVLERAAESGALSARALQSVRRVARTVADLGGRDAVGVQDVTAAIGLRAGL